MSSCVGLFNFSSLVGLRLMLSGLSYELGLNGAKKVNWSWYIINKNGHSTFHTGKHDIQCQKKLLHCGY